ncbi:hypothetical protein [Methanocella sp. MCL-LM]|uniref:hypothetical protein n=1 Tax=Methanocella sp. MCL-LM TaxID=3412035 RepID=UPI003C73460F
MLRAVTNRDFPMLRAVLEKLFGIALEYDPALFPDSKAFTGPFQPDNYDKPGSRLRSLASSMGRRYKVYRTFRQVVRQIRVADPENRIRIVFVDGAEDLSFGMAPRTNIIGFNVARHKLIFVGVPPELDPISPDCDHAPETLDGYLVAVTLHELYENLTGDVSHCRNPGKCINSICRHYENGTCCVCMGGLIDRKYPDLTLEDLFCEEDLSELRRALNNQ